MLLVISRVKVIYVWGHEILGGGGDKNDLESLQNVTFYFLIYNFIMYSLMSVCMFMSLQLF